MQEPRAGPLHGPGAGRAPRSAQSVSGKACAIQTRHPIPRVHKFRIFCHLKYLKINKSRHDRIVDAIIITGLSTQHITAFLSVLIAGIGSGGAEYLQAL